MKFRMMLLAMFISVSIFAIGAMDTDTDVELPEEQTETTIETSSGLESEDSRMLVGEMRRKYGQWFIETADDMIQLILPESSEMRNMGCELADRDNVIIYGRFSKDRLIVDKLEKNGATFDFTE